MTTPTHITTSGGLISAAFIEYLGACFITFRMV